MFKKTDPNTYTKYCSLINGKNQEVIGTLALEYQVVLYEDVQSYSAASVSKPQSQHFVLNCTQRINIYNSSSQNLTPTTGLTAYDNYPAMLNTSMYLVQAGGMKYKLLEYSPETINTVVETSASAGDESGVSTGNSHSQTSGSTISQTNTYGTSVTVGETNSGATASYEHSSTVAKEHSRTNETNSSNNRSANSARSASMSIKDWGAYALINPITQKPIWTFGQESPWDAIECKDSTGALYAGNTDQVQLVIPNSMLVNLYGGTSTGVTLNPPSELSRFGINFVMKASWIVAVSNDVSDEITIDHVINYFSASHTLTSSGSSNIVSVYIDQNPNVLQVGSDESLSTTINLNFMALDPLGLRSNAAIVGFIPSKFITLPVPASSSSALAVFKVFSSTSTSSGVPVPFKIISSTNDLMMQDTTTYPADCDAGAGFTASQTSLTANFAENCTSLQATAYFKVIDSVTTYMLYMKHYLHAIHEALENRCNRNYANYGHKR